MIDLAGFVVHANSVSADRSSAMRSSSSISGLMSRTASKGSGSMRGLTAEVSREELFSKLPLLITNRGVLVYTFARSVMCAVKENCRQTLNVRTWGQRENSSFALNTCFHERNWTRALQSYQSGSWTPSAPSTPLLCRPRWQMTGPSQPKHHFQTGSDFHLGMRALHPPCMQAGERKDELCVKMLNLQAMCILKV